jgi:CheY-like chemotaxis protein
VTTFQRGREAIEAFRLGPHDFDVVLTDLTMPELDGLKVAEQLHAIRSDIPILLASGIGVDRTPAALAAHGIRETLGKPFNAAAIGAAIRRALDGKAAEPE